ncbi:DUF3307 domain-containing protein [Caldanaerobacter subterraneus]|uniref:DUF3307 domain-containing protein n=2 Tax=Caldanaerobacter subterraneus TaxID=911092 RepID=U5CSV0_CALSX|nr:DUF3307 domain-containing protein [Caldanaerobacter subterraneus]ERM93043.1 hypothetical protein O163_01920 [Caldanaerobacter subterraneus subsp. yonseiensis KB-1]NNG67399.1 DUF3307 domain-containing protein [Caldanaerobacter subterraneus]
MKVLLFAIILLLFSHGLSDYIFQTEKMVKRKADGNFKGFIEHFLIVLSLNIVLMAFFTARAFPCLVILSMLHILIDWGKYKLFKSESLTSFVLDQFFHIFTIVLIGLAIADFLRPFFLGAYLQPYFQVFSTLTVYVYVVLGGAIFIKYALLSPLVYIPRAEITTSGRIIGIIERILMTTLVAMGQVAAAGFVIAAKSIARYKELDDKNFAEYYLIGTMLSMLLALLGGILIRFLYQI